VDAVADKKLPVSNDTTTMYILLTLCFKVYGINTGFGNFATVSIPEEKLSELQWNLITSHAAGMGPPLTLERTRMLLALRVNVLAKGYRF
jgi:histidine ammonia-lyase